MSNIIKIIIRGDFFTPWCFKGHDELTLTENSIAYEYTAIKEDDNYAGIKWKYNTDSIAFKSKFKEIVSIFESDDKEWENFNMDDVGSVELDITYDDGTIFKEEYYAPTGCFSNFFDSIKPLVPKVEKLPMILISTKEEWIENVGEY